jgi:adenylate cyclase
VHFVLQGSVQRNGTKIRINAQLADANSNAQLWSEIFEGEQSDLFALQDRVTTLVGNSIGREMVIVAARESESRKSSPKVADLVLRARAVDLKPESLKNEQQIEDLYRQALALEPNNTNAMLGLAASLAYEAEDFGSSQDESVREKKWVEARNLTLRGKELDPDNPKVYSLIEMYANNHGDFEGSMRAAMTALSLAPKNPSAYNNLAVEFLGTGEPRRAIELLTQALNLDPKHSDDTVLVNMGRAFFMLGNYDAAVDWLQKALDKDTVFPIAYAYLAMAYALKGDEAKARAATANLRRVDPSFKLLTAEKPDSSQPAAFKDWYEAKLIPASRKAELPE